MHDPLAGSGTQMFYIRLSQQVKICKKQLLNAEVSSTCIVWCINGSWSNKGEVKPCKVGKNTFILRNQGLNKFAGIGGKVTVFSKIKKVIRNFGGWNIIFFLQSWEHFPTLWNTLKKGEKSEIGVKCIIGFGGMDAPAWMTAILCMSLKFIEL